MVSDTSYPTIIKWMYYTDPFFNQYIKNASEKYNELVMDTLIRFSSDSERVDEMYYLISMSRFNEDVIFKMLCNYGESWVKTTTYNSFNQHIMDLREKQESILRSFSDTSPTKVKEEVGV